MQWSKGIHGNFRSQPSCNVWMSKIPKVLGRGRVTPLYINAMVSLELVPILSLKAGPSLKERQRTIVQSYIQVHVTLIPYMSPGSFFPTYITNTQLHARWVFPRSTTTFHSLYKWLLYLAGKCYTSSSDW